MQQSTDKSQTTGSILDEYCRYYSDFCKVLGIYIKTYYPKLNFQLEQLLDASYNVWHRLNDEEKISLATFIEDINRENNNQTKTFNNLLNSELNQSKPLSSNANSDINDKKLFLKKRHSISPFNIYLKDERKNFLKKHSKMSMGEINKRLANRWQKMSNRMKQKYEHRSYLAKKRLYKTRKINK